MYVKTKSDIYNSIVEFNAKSGLWKSALGTGPKYFVHFQKGSKHYFGLSKFCVFKNISVEDYILKKIRHDIGGGEAQKKIAKILNNKWTPASQIDPLIKSHFDNWISNFFPNYNPSNAFFITLLYTSDIIIPKMISPEDLQKSLAKQARIGALGEEIALKFEINRLKDRGLKNAKEFIKHISLKNISAGYDIYSITKNETRYIEVKSSTTKKNEFYLTENEISILENLEHLAFLYIVRITDLSKGEGYVDKIIQNPITYLKTENLLKPIAFKIKL